MMMMMMMTMKITGITDKRKAEEKKGVIEDDSFRCVLSPWEARVFLPHVPLSETERKSMKKTT